MKKNGFVFVGMLAMVLAFGLVVIGCDDGNNTPTINGGTGGGPEKSAIELTADTYTESVLAAGGEKWFKFIATASTQYIYFSPGNLTNVYVQLYNSSVTATGTSAYLGQYSDTYISRPVTVDNVYYLKVTQSSGSGTFKIGFTKSIITPDARITDITADTWIESTLQSGYLEWFRFTATASTQYIHFSQENLTNVYVQLYDSNITETGANGYLGQYSNSYITRAVTIGNVYYLKVTASSGSGTYKIGITNSIIIPGFIPTELTDNTWCSGTLSSNQYTWFKFTATASTQYIHFSPGNLTNVDVQLYDGNVTATGASAYLGQYTNTYISRPVTIGNVYYLRVTQSSGSGTYKIGFNTSTTTP